MTQTFEGKSCRIHYNSDLSGEIEVQTERAEDRVKTFYAVSPGTDICTTRINGSDLLFFFRHLQEPGGALAEKLHAVEREVGAPTIQVPVKTRQEPNGQWLAYWMAPCELQPEDLMTGRGKTEQEALIELQTEMSWEDGK